MKKVVSSSLILTIIILSFCQGGFTSCSKDKLFYDTITVVKNDTITLKDTVLSSAILTSHTWKIQEARGVFGGDTTYYLRGSTISSVNLDSSYITFNTDGTGFYQDATGISHIIADWKFTNAANTQLTFKYYITPSGTYYVITWDNIHFKNNSIINDEYYHDITVNKNYHGQVIRIPK